MNENPAGLTLAEIERLMTEAVVSTIEWHEVMRRAYYAKTTVPDNESIWEWIGAEKSVEILGALATLAELKMKLHP
jgi:hypothetical protein